MINVHSRWARFLYRSYLYFLSQATRPLLKAEQHYRKSKEQPNDRLIEYTFALKALRDQAHRGEGGPVLDVGSGDSSWPHLLWFSGFTVRAIDKVVGYERFPVRNRHYLIQHEDITKATETKELYKTITCISTLEHIRAFDTAMREMCQLLQPGGILLLTVPWGESYVPDLVSFLGPDSHYSQAAREEGHLTQLFSETQLTGWLQLEWKLVLREDWRLFTGHYYMQGQQLNPPIPLSGHSPFIQLSCFVFQKE